MPMDFISTIYLTADVTTAGFWAHVGESPLLTAILVISGIIIGLFIGFLYSVAKTRFSKTEADRKLRRIVANFEQEKDASETILRELQVGILAYGGDGRMISVNPSASANLGTEDIPKTFQAFLNKYGTDNGIQAAFVLQTPNITGLVNVGERTIKLRLTQSQLPAFHKPSWIIIIQDITEQEREEKQRKDFVANVSHELKTPLTTISAYSETLLDWGLEGKPLPDVRNDIVRIHDDAVRMDSLVQNLLLLSSIDSRGIRPKMSQYDIVYVMKQVVNRMQVQAVEKEIQLESSVLSIIPPVFGDASAIDRIVTNLVSNGIKYTDVRGYVSVSIQLTNDYISMKVADNGMGVAKDNLTRLFNRFYRVDSTGSRKYGGTGLGLSIAKELTEIQGGTITVASVLGKGTEFVVTIPKAEKLYRDTLTAIFDGTPRHEIVYENAQAFLTQAAEEIDIPVHDLSELKPEQIEDLLSYLLAIPDRDELEYPIVSPADLLPARYEAERRTRRIREQTEPNPSAISRSAVRKAAMESSSDMRSLTDMRPDHVPKSRAAAQVMPKDTIAAAVPKISNPAGTASPVRVTPARVTPAAAPSAAVPKDGGRTGRSKSARDANVFTIEQLQTESLKGENHA